MTILNGHPWSMADLQSSMVNNGSLSSKMITLLGLNSKKKKKKKKKTFDKVSVNIFYLMKSFIGGAYSTVRLHLQ